MLQEYSQKFVENLSPKSKFSKCFTEYNFVREQVKKESMRNRPGKSLFDSSLAPPEDQKEDDVTLGQRWVQKAEDKKQDCCG